MEKSHIGREDSVQVRFVGMHPYPPARSFRRRGRMTAGRQLRWAELWPRFGLTAADLAEWQPNALDVGFGNGASVVHLATEQPTWRVVGVEVHESGMVQLLDALNTAGLDNVRLVRDDVFDVFNSIRLGSLERINVFCPDPWPKAAQMHRRLIRPAVVDEFVQRLAVGGILHLVTDIADYADQMRDACARDDLQPTDAPARASTKYETRGRFEGRSIADLAYRRVAVVAT
jgi:tRNA (guanine-N7-)-methyltransferase